MFNATTREQDLFEQALDLDHQDWGPFLLAACGEDLALLARVRSLLAAHQHSATFMASPAAGVFADDSHELDHLPGTVIGPYCLQEQIGMGGMGVVYLAQQKQPVQRLVALKLIKPGMDTRQVIARFEAERQALALMDHPHIARVYDGGSTNQGHPYFVMELVRGVPITEFCTAEALPIPERLKLFIQVCRAVQHAHQKGIIHRDLKPSNVLVTRHDAVPVPKIIDFGVAKAMHQSLTNKTIYTSHAQVLGTPAYMSPEQAQLGGLDIDTRSDVYSLGVLLYELLTGTPPFANSVLHEHGLDELRRMIREDEPVLPSQRVSTLKADQESTLVLQPNQPTVQQRRLKKLLRGDLDWIVMRALEKDRARRYQSASDLADDVQRYLKQEAVEASSPSHWYRWCKYVRRNRTAILTATTIAAALCASTGISLWQARVAQLAREQADEQRRQTELISAQSQLTVAMRNLNENDGRGLLELVEAQKTARQNPDIERHIARIWNVASTVRANRLAQMLPAGESLAIRGDSRVLAIAAGSKVTLWDMQTGKQTIEPLELGHSISVVTFSPDGQFVGAHSFAGFARVWNSITGEPATPLLVHDGQPLSSGKPNGQDTIAAFHPDGKRFITGAADGTVRKWEVPGGQPAGQVFRCAGAITTLDVSPDGRYIAAGIHQISDTDKRRIFVWNLKTDELAFPPQEFPQGDLVQKVLFSTNSKYLADGTGSRISIHDVSNGSITRIHGAAPWLEDIAGRCDSQQWATADAGWNAMLWNETSGSKPHAVLRHQGRVRKVAYSPDGALVVTASTDQTVRFWRSETGLPQLAPHQHQARVDRMCYAADGQFLAATSGETCRIWRPMALPWRERHRFRPAFPSLFAGNADQSRFAIGANERTVKVFRSGKETAVIPLADDETLCGLAFSPESTLLAIGVRCPSGSRIRIWDVVREQWITSLPANNEGILSLAWSPNSQRVAIGTVAWNVVEFDLATQQPCQKFPALERVYSLAYHPDGQHILTGSRGGDVRKWQLSDGQQVGRTLHCSSAIDALACSPDGEIVAAVNNEAGKIVVRLWFIGQGAPDHTLVLPYHPKNPYLFFNEAGDLVLCGETQNTLVQWQFPDKLLSADEAEQATWKMLGLRIGDDTELKPIPWQEWQQLPPEKSRR